MSMCGQTRGSSIMNISSIGVRYNTDSTKQYMYQLEKHQLVPTRINLSSIN